MGEVWVEFDSNLVMTRTKLPTGNYSGGEVIMKMEKEKQPPNVICRVHNSDELMRLIHYMHAAVGQLESVCLPYLPYARQDRATDTGTHNAVEVLALLLATSGVKKFMTFDVHSHASVVAFSKAGLELENRNSAPFIDAYLATLESKGMIDRTKVALVVPDKGGRARKDDQRDSLAAGRAIDVPIFYCDKVRDTKTGKITSMRVDDDSPATIADGTAVFCVDDICDGGATFGGVAKVMLERYPNIKSSCSMHLWVTHGIFSKGIDPMM